MEKVYSGLSYFYSLNDNMQGIMTFNVKLKETVQCKLLEEAINDALLIHEHFKVRLVIKNNNVYYDKNVNEARVYEGIRKDFSLIKETEEYIISFRVENEMICVDVFHMLADGDGFFNFFKTVLLYYFSKAYENDMNWESLIEGRKDYYAEAVKNEDPYTIDILANEEIETEKEDIHEYLQLCKEEDSSKILYMKWDYNEYQKKSDIGEFSPYIVANVLLGNVIEEIYGKDEKIGAYIPVNMRKRLGLEKSMYNCLSYVNAEHISKYDKKSLYEQCAEYSMLLKQKYKQKNTLLTKMKEDVKLIEIMQNEKISMNRKCGMIQGLFKRTRRIRGTFGMSYVNFCTEDDIYKQYITEFAAWAPNSGMGIMSVILLLGNEVNLCMRYGEKQQEIVNSFVQSIRALNFNVEVREIEDINTKIAIDTLIL